MPTGLTVQQGPNDSGAGITGISNDAEGVLGQSTDDLGVHGVSSNSVGVLGESSNSTGIVGYSSSTDPEDQDGIFGGSVNGVGVSGSSNSDAGVYGFGFAGPGVSGFCSSQPGVAGVSLKNAGVFGGSPTLGVRGAAQDVRMRGTGVAGTCHDGDGVYGECTGQGSGVHGKSSTGIGVYGEDTYQFAGGVGVQGTSDNGWGVTGHGGGYAGVYGEGTGAAHGMWGDATRSSGSGVYARAAGSPPGPNNTVSATPAAVQGGGNLAPGVYAWTDTGEFALVASSSLARNTNFTVRNSGHQHGAAAFGGDVSVSGGLYVEGPLKVLGNPKSAVVRVPDGSHRSLYCMESPECWFEDFGRGRLVRGRGKVTLDRMFAAVVHTADYHVFLSPEGASRGIYVSRRTRGGFEVREQGEGTSTLGFSYRIVARRKDVKAPRFLKEPLRPITIRHTRTVSAPKAAAGPRRFKTPALPAIPKLPKRRAPRKLPKRLTSRTARRRQTPA